MSEPNNAKNDTSATDHPDTRFESIEDIRKAIAGSQRIVTAKETGAVDDTHAHRPVYRPPMATVCILDDGEDDGEWVHIRADKTIIGRSEGTIIIPHDAMMSSKHASITRHTHKGGFRWLLTDLGSTNGTFVRVSDTPIKHGQEVLFGSRRFRFNAAPQGAAGIAETPDADAGKPPATKGWQVVSPRDLIPSLIEVTPQGDGKEFILTGADAWIGRDPRQCTVVIGDDLMISPRHCRLHRDGNGLWHLENAGSRNGTWVRITKVPLNTNGQFQLGEQRFFVRVQS